MYFPGAPGYFYILTESGDKYKCFGQYELGNTIRIISIQASTSDKPKTEFLQPGLYRKLKSRFEYHEDLPVFELTSETEVLKPERFITKAGTFGALVEYTVGHGGEAVIFTITKVIATNDPETFKVGGRYVLLATVKRSGDPGDWPNSGNLASLVEEVKPF